MLRISTFVRLCCIFELSVILLNMSVLLLVLIILFDLREEARSLGTGAGVGLMAAAGEGLGMGIVDTYMFCIQIENDSKRRAQVIKHIMMHLLFSLPFGAPIIKHIFLRPNSF